MARGHRRPGPTPPPGDHPLDQLLLPGQDQEVVPRRLSVAPVKDEHNPDPQRGFFHAHQDGLPVFPGEPQGQRCVNGAHKHPSHPGLQRFPRHVTAEDYCAYQRSEPASVDPVCEPGARAHHNPGPHP